MTTWTVSADGESQTVGLGAAAAASAASTSATAAAASALAAAESATLAANAVSAAAATGSLPGVNQCGIMIPFYIYPNNPYSDATVQALLGLIRFYRSVPVTIILNPSSGPGTVWDGNYAATITLLQGAGAQVLGYVSTAYGARAEAAVKADILLWTTLYSATPVNGCFLDEQPYATAGGVVDLYARYTTYAHSLSLYPVVANPGTNQQQAWFASPTADVIIVHETGSWPVESDMAGNFVGGHSNYPQRLRAALVYGQSTLDLTKLRWLRKYVNWIYIDSDALPNPWDTLPTYLSQLFAALASPTDQPLSVEEFGALGDGTTDDTAAFVLARAASATVVLQAGKIYLLNAWAPGSRTAVIGNGARIRRAAGATCAINWSNTYGSLDNVTFDQDIKLASGLVDPTKAAVSTVVSFPTTTTIAVTSAATFVAGMTVFFESTALCREEANVILSVNTGTNVLTVQQVIVGSAVVGGKILADFPLLSMGNGTFRSTMTRVHFQRFVVGMQTGTGVASSNAAPLMSNVSWGDFIGAAWTQRESFGVEIISNFAVSGGTTKTVTYTATAAQTQFAYLWDISPRSHKAGDQTVTVTSNGVTLTETTQYTVTDTAGNGYITLVTPATVGDTVVVRNTEKAARGFFFCGISGSINSAGRMTNGVILDCSTGAEVHGGTAGIEYMYGAAVTIDGSTHCGLWLRNVANMELTGWSLLYSPYPLIIDSSCANIQLSPLRTSVKTSGDIHNAAAYPSRAAITVESGATKIRIPAATWSDSTSYTVVGTAYADFGYFRDGLVTAPSITFSGDADTGLWHPTADRVEIVTGGQRALLITEDNRAVLGTAGKLQMPSGMTVSSGSGTPEGAVTAEKGSIYLRTDGAAGTALYCKESGSGNTGWVSAANFGGQFTDGLVTAPSIAFSGDTNTGLWRPTTDRVEIVTGGQRAALFTEDNRLVLGTSGKVQMASGTTISSGAGTPEGAVTAPKGSLFLRTDGAAGTAFYVKESGSSTTGWVAK